MNIATALANCAAYFGKWWTSDEQVKARKDAAKADISAAVNEGKKDEVNAFLKKTLVVPAMVGMLLLSGCATKVVYVSYDREVYPMTSTNGIAGWFVPNATMDDMTRRLNDAK